ncbi:putative C-type lectin domain family 20 member A [Pangasianodon hypophthalmus]|nr:putative C-type lectin domain family 20 member A [Pangasianodon hypophthalmus]
MIKLQNEAQKHQFTSNAWIGLFNDVTSWRWSLGNQPLGPFTAWCSSEPNYRMEDCTAFNQWCWFDVACSVSLPFVCFDAKSTGSSRYILISTSMTFHDAQSYCRQHHTDLASVINEEENVIIKQLVSSNSWFGLFRDLWKWSDQSNFSTVSWVSGKPWGAGIDDNCANFIKGQVDAAQCSEMMPFFCLSDFTKEQIMRMKVKSNQDVNDPAVKAAILQKIKQKLKEHGIAENTTMKWREQPDGMVFHKIIM